MSSFDTVDPADCLEFCPHPEASDIFVCGTYKLNERSTSDDRALSASVPLREGRCLVLQVDPDRGVDAPAFRQIQAINFPAIPDMKWQQTSSSTNPVLGIADSEGNVTVLQWHLQERTLSKLHSVPCASQDTLCLSLDWSNRRTPQADFGNLVTSLSNGTLCLLRPTSHGEFFKTDEWPAHEHEPWVAAWDYWDTNVIYSGGDDLALKLWDIRQDLSRPFFTNRKFEAGVTTVQSHLHMEYLIAVGSYKDTVYLFDRRKATLALSETAVGGGVWRVKWNPFEGRKEDLSVACMQDGFKILRYDSSMDRAHLKQRFDCHESLAYGVDWSYGPPTKDGKQIVGSCSFYDHLLHLWKA